jgi:hypothetical protein
VSGVSAYSCATRRRAQARDRFSRQLYGAAVRAVFACGVFTRAPRANNSRASIRRSCSSYGCSRVKVAHTKTAQGGPPNAKRPTARVCVSMARRTRHPPLSGRCACAPPPPVSPGRVVIRLVALVCLCGRVLPFSFTASAAGAAPRQRRDEASRASTCRPDTGSCHGVAGARWRNKSILKSSQAARKGNPKRQ